MKKQSLREGKLPEVPQAVRQRDGALTPEARLQAAAIPSHTASVCEQHQALFLPSPYYVSGEDAEFSVMFTCIKQGTMTDCIRCLHQTGVGQGGRSGKASQNKNLELRAGK